MAVTSNKRLNYVRIDEAQVEKLREIAKKKGLNCTALDNELGRSSGFLKQCCLNGWISKADLKLIKLTFDIDVELHEPVTPEPKMDEEPAQTQTTVLNVEELVSAVRANNVISKHIEEQNAELIDLLKDIRSMMRDEIKRREERSKNVPRTYRNYTGIKNGELQFTDMREGNN